MNRVNVLEMKRFRKTPFSLTILTMYECNAELSNASVTFIRVICEQ